VTIKKNSKPTYDNPETVAQFTFCGVTHRIVIFERNGQWHSHYKRIGEGVIAHGEARSRQELMRA
jgi:hypothetical protein